LNLRKKLLNLFVGSGFLYFVDESSGAPIVPLSSESSGTSPIVLENPTEAVERLLPLMLMGMIRMRGEKSTALLAKTIMEGKHTPPEKWITLSQNLVRYLYSQKSQQCSGNTSKEEDLLSLSDALADFVSRATRQNARRRPESEDGREWVSELSYLKTLYDQSAGAVPSSMRLTSATGRQDSAPVSDSKEMPVEEETNGPSFNEPMPQKTLVDQSAGAIPSSTRLTGTTGYQDNTPISHSKEIAVEEEVDGRSFNVPIPQKALLDQSACTVPSSTRLTSATRCQGSAPAADSKGMAVEDTASSGPSFVKPVPRNEPRIIDAEDEDDLEKKSTPADNGVDHDDKDSKGGTNDRSLPSKDICSESRDQTPDKPRRGLLVPPQPNLDNNRKESPVKNRGNARPDDASAEYRLFSKGESQAAKVTGYSAKTNSPDTRPQPPQEKQGRSNISKQSSAPLDAKSHFNIFQEQEERLKCIKKRFESLDREEQKVMGRVREPVRSLSYILAAHEDRGRYHRKEGKGKTRTSRGEPDSDSFSDDNKMMQMMLSDAKEDYIIMFASRISGLEENILEREVEIQQLKLDVCSFAFDSAVAIPESELSDEYATDLFQIDTTYESGSSEEDGNHKSESSDGSKDASVISICDTTDQPGPCIGSNIDVAGQCKDSSEIDADGATCGSEPGDESTQDASQNSSDDTTHNSESSNESQNSIKINLDDTTDQPDSRVEPKDTFKVGAVCNFESNDECKASFDVDAADNISGFESSDESTQDAPQNSSDGTTHKSDSCDESQKSFETNLDNTADQPNSRVKSNQTFRVDAVCKFDSGEESNDALDFDAADAFQGSEPSDESTEDSSGNCSDDTTHKSESSDESQNSIKIDLDDTTDQADSRLESKDKFKADAARTCESYYNCMASLDVAAADDASGSESSDEWTQDASPNSLDDTNHESESSDESQNSFKIDLDDTADQPDSRVESNDMFRVNAPRKFKSFDECNEPLEFDADDSSQGSTSTVEEPLEFDADDDSSSRSESSDESSQDSSQNSSDDTTHKCESSNESQNSSEINADDTPYQSDASVEVNETFRADAVCKIDSDKVCEDTFEVDAYDGTQGSESSDELTQNLSGNSSDDTTHLSECSDESKFLPWASLEGRLIETKVGQSMFRRDVNEKMSPKSDSSDVSKDSSKSNNTIDSIMEEAFGFLSRTAEEGLWIEADDGKMLFVRCVNASKGHKTDSTGEITAAGGLVSLTEAALESNLV
jgi:hypothetical protein